MPEKAMHYVDIRYLIEIHHSSELHLEN